MVKLSFKEHTMKRALITAAVLALLAGSVMATIFVVADPGGTTMTFRSDQLLKLTITSTKLVPLPNDPNSIELVVRLKVS